MNGIPFETQPTAVLLDWAGTTIDPGSRAPTRVFREVFARRGIEITSEEARGPMGRSKIDHIAALASLPRVAEAWGSKYGSEPGDDAVRTMYEEFLPLQKRILAEGCELIPGVIEAVAHLRGQGLGIGSTTGYTLALMEVVAPLASAAGYAPDVIVCSDEVDAGRPDPAMNQLAARRLGVASMASVIIVDDTEVGIRAARNAGAVAVGVSRTGNGLGLGLEEVNALDREDLRARLVAVESSFLEAGAHAVLESVADLPRFLGGA